MLCLIHVKVYVCMYYIILWDVLGKGGSELEVAGMTGKKTLSYSLDMSTCERQFRPALGIRKDFF